MINIKTLTSKNKLPNMHNIVDKEEEKKKEERSRPSVERRKTPNEKKYNEFVANLYKKVRKSKK